MKDAKYLETWRVYPTPSPDWEEKPVYKWGVPPPPPKEKTLDEILGLE